MPFSITPDPAYLYLSPRHQEALGHLLYGTGQYGGFVQLTGEVGTGKTTVIRALLAQPIDDVDVAMVHHPRLSEREFLASVCDELGIPASTDDSLRALITTLNQHLLKTHAAGRRTVLIIDEAQNLDPALLEQVRLLTNLETHKEKLLRIMLVGQPELNDLLARDDLRQLAQRITARFHLTPLAANETAEYVRHRLRVAGARGPIFTPEALTALHRESGGTPRLINVIADRALLGAYAEHLLQIDAGLVARAAEEALGHQHCKMPPAPAAQQTERRAWLPWLERALPVIALLLASVLLLRSCAPTLFAPVPSPESQADIAATEVTPPTPVPSLEPAPEPAGLSDFDSAMRPLPELLGTLVSRWDDTLVPIRASTLCLDLQPDGYECHRDDGGFARLTQLGRPAIVELSILDQTHHVLVLWLSATEAGLFTPDGPITVDRETLEILAPGDFLTLFARPTESRRLDGSTRGDDLVWLHERLTTLLGEDARPPPDRFDATMVRRVRRFQSEKQLQVDGVVGSQTLMVLTQGLPDTPNLEPPANVTAP
ncbi:ExeA family protein [Polycyclovorans algicola]|uniref:ExeA family protein n=1 Tax=Polycyclovorans algicola TaxID=616992 RepID=UPI0006936730|nr:ExeA family protein [Polycyclovorans algicola]